MGRERKYQESLTWMNSDPKIQKTIQGGWKPPSGDYRLFLDQEGRRKIDQKYNSVNEKQYHSITYLVPLYILYFSLQREFSFREETNDRL